MNPFLFWAKQRGAKTLPSAEAFWQLQAKVEDLERSLLVQSAAIERLQRDQDRLPLGGGPFYSSNDTLISMFQTNSAPLRSVVYGLLHYLKLEVKQEGWRLEKKKEPGDER